MKTGVSVFAVMLGLAGLCVGCGKAVKSEPVAVAVPTDSDTRIAVPEKMEQPSANAGHDHGGHSHAH
jgi:hypothetical protein